MRELLAAFITTAGLTAILFVGGCLMVWCVRSYPLVTIICALGFGVLAAVIAARLLIVSRMCPRCFHRTDKCRCGGKQMQIPFDRQEGRI